MSGKTVTILIIVFGVLFLLVIFLNYKKSSDEAKRKADAEANEAAILQQAIAMKQQQQAGKTTAKDILGTVSSIAGIFS